MATLTEACSPAEINVVDGGVRGTGLFDHRHMGQPAFTDATVAADEKVITYTWTEVWLNWRFRPPHSHDLGCNPT
ncbi:MAG: hypothetical protein U0Z17_07460 [Bacteroidales bacterium]